MAMERKSLFAKDIAELACEFLEVAVHLILHVRELYPAEVFERRRHYNVPVQWARHPGLREYIYSTLISLKTWIQQGAVEKIAVVILDGKHVPVEKFVFDVHINPAYNAPELPQGELEYALRAFLIKISVSESLLKPLPPGCTWELVAYFKQLPKNSTPNWHLWIPAEHGELGSQVAIVPIKSLRGGPLQLQLYLEQLTDSTEAEWT